MYRAGAGRASAPDRHTVRVLHVRVVCPFERTAEILAVFQQEPGATNLVCLPKAALSPPGDVVQAEVAREAVDGLLVHLRELGVHRDGSVVMLTIDTALGAGIDQAEAEAPGEGDDAVIWDQLTKLTAGASNASASFLAFLTIATMIAAVGLLTDSLVLIVGAMVLGPEFGPLAGLAVALVRRRWRDAVNPLRALVIGFPLAILVTAVGVLALDLTGNVPEAFLAGKRPLTSFVAAPDLFSVIIALLAGVAGVLSLTGAKSSPLVGVFISVTTVPAAADIAAGAVTGQYSTAAGATAQLAVNLSCIVAAAVVTLVVQRAYWHRLTRHHPRRRPDVSPLDSGGAVRGPDRLRLR